MTEHRVRASPLESLEQKRWDQGDAHGLAVAAVMQTRREMEESYRGLDRMVEERAFKPYVYHTISGAGTALESALRHADSRVLVGRPRSSGALSNQCLNGFVGFGAGAGDASGLGGAASKAVREAPGGYGLGNSSLGGSGLASAGGSGSCGIVPGELVPLPATTAPDAPRAPASRLFDVSTRPLLSGASSLPHRR